VVDLLQDLIGVVPAGVYADARWVAQRSERVAIRTGDVDSVDSDAEQGIGVRVARDGGWGFAATRDVSPAGAREALRRALAIAEAQPVAAARPLAPVPPAEGEWAGDCEIDPFSVSLEDKLALLLGAEALAAGDELQVRSYPSAHGGDVAAAGWEQVLGLDLTGNAPRVRDEALELLTAPPCPSGRHTLVLGDEQLALQLHESVGHALELDRILLMEASYAGTSWVGADDIGRLRYGSDTMNVTADSTLPGALGSFGWDDEGVAARRTALLEEGMVRAALADRQSAAAIGMEGSNGCARADGFARQPIVRMTNVSLEPGSAGTLADLIADTDSGLFMETNRSWSIDDRRLHFQFATEIAREIRDGELGQLYRNASYHGVTPRFWASLDAVCSAPAWRLWGLLNCGKGEPGQVAHVSHGTAPARFRDVEVGVA
jgi:TldD protein